MDRALELGINFFDTADVYGWSVEHGSTEEIIGRWLAQGGGRRDAVILATKVYNPVTRKANRPEPNADGRSLSAVKIKKHCEGSLRRLQTDWIDLYQMHHVDRSCPWDEAWQGFNSLVQQGKIVYTGSSNFAGWDIATACQEAARRGMAGLVSEQSIYNLNSRMIELEVIPACRHYGLGLIPWSPLAGGLLGGALGKAQAGRRMDAEFRQAGGKEPLQARAVRGALPGTGRGAWHRGAGLAAAQPGGHGADHRPPDRGAAGKRRACHGSRTGRRRAEAARRDLSGPRRRSARGLRLVAETPKILVDLPLRP